jgi:hypothetical protein
VKHFSCAPLEGRLLTLPTNIRRVLKGLPVTNTPSVSVNYDRQKFYNLGSRSSASDEALLPDVKVKTSPRRSNRENLPLLRPGRQRHNSYDDIDVDFNNFTGEI